MDYILPITGSSKHSKHHFIDCSQWKTYDWGTFKWRCHLDRWYKFLVGLDLTLFMSLCVPVASSLVRFMFKAWDFVYYT